MKFKDVFKEKIINLPNFITLLRVVLLPFLLYYSSFFLKDNSIYRLEVIILMLVLFLTDFLDGFIARKMNQITMFGKYFDPVADMLTILSLLFLLVFVKNFPLWIFILYLLREIGSIYIASYLYFKRDKQVLPSFIGKITTFLAFFVIFLYFIEDIIHIRAIYASYIFSIFIISTYIESYFRFKNDIFNHYNH